MPTIESYYRQLMERYLKNEVSEAEARELFDFNRQLPEIADKILEDSGGQDFAGYIKSIARADDLTKKRVLEKLLNTISIPSREQEHRIHFSRKRWFRYAAAAVLFALIAGGYFWWQRPANKAAIPSLAALPGHDILPGTNKAILTLSGGRQVILDPVHQDTVLTEGAAIVAGAKGKLAYNAGNQPAIEMVYNTLTTPRGGQYQLTLPDGTQVWLNAASSITYPTAFTGRDRTVAITGEVYLEVAADAGKPFRVTAAGETVTVLGTSFNINAYADEIRLRTTLITGAIVVSIEGARRQLQPGQQATVTPGKTGVEVAPDADLDQVLAWKNGAINFNGLNLEQAMRQLERWYDIEVVYEKGVPAVHLWGELGRNVSLKSLLKGLEESKLHFRIEEGRRLVVLP